MIWHITLFLDAEGLVPPKLLQLALVLTTCHQLCQRRITVGGVSDAYMWQLQHAFVRVDGRV
jgi:hypothetical protein